MCENTAERAFSNFMIRNFAGSKYLSKRKDLSTIEKIDNIGAVEETVAGVIKSDGDIRNAPVVDYSKSDMSSL